MRRRCVLVVVRRLNDDAPDPSDGQLFLKKSTTNPEILKQTHRSVSRGESHTTKSTPSVSFKTNETPEKKPNFAFRVRGVFLKLKKNSVL